MTYSLFGNFKRLLKRVAEKDKSIFLDFVVYTIAATIFPFLGVFLPKVVIGEIIKDQPDFTLLVYYLIGFFVLITIVGVLKNFSDQHSYFKIPYIRIDYFTDLADKYYSADFKYTEDPKFLNEYHNSFQTIGNHQVGVEGNLHLMFYSGALIFGIIGYVILVGNLSWIIFAYLIINVLVNFLTLKAIKKYEYSFKDQKSDMNRRINYFRNMSQDFSFGKEIRLYNMEDNIITKYNHQTNKLLGIYNKIFSRDFYLNIINFVVILIREGLVYGYLIYSFAIGDIKIDDFTMYLVAIVSLATAMNSLVTNISEYVGNDQYITDFFKLLDRELIHDENDFPIPDDYTYEIEFKNVNFKYPNTDKYVLKDFNLKINKGEKIAIVGINGAGKTTIVKLLMRLYDIEEGSILINGININQFNKQEYYKLFSAVFQEFKMFAISIKENIALDFEKIDDDKVINSLKMVGLDEKINNLSAGLDTNVLKIIDPKGVEFSGGENQKLAITRALYKDAPIVILDEPTATLDALAEQKIYEELNELVKDKTSIFISHRLASTKFCDRIVLINNSHIEECGTHEELLRNKKYYYEMFMTQAKYYLEDEAYEEI